MLSTKAFLALSNGVGCKKSQSSSEQTTTPCSQEAASSAPGLSSDTGASQQAGTIRENFPKKVDGLPAEETPLLVFSYCSDVREKGGNSRKKIKRNQLKTRPCWNAPLHPVKIYIISQEECITDDFFDKHRSIFTILFHDLCQFSAMLFRSGKYKKIEVKCSNGLIKGIFADLEESIIKSFVAWFSQLCAQYQTENVFVPSDVGYIEYDGDALPHIPQASAGPQPILYNEADAFIQCIRAGLNAEEKLHESLSLAVHRLPAQLVSSFSGKQLPDMIKHLQDQGQQSTLEVNMLELVLIPCSTTLWFLDCIEDLRNDKAIGQQLKYLESEIAKKFATFALTNLNRQVGIRQHLHPWQLHQLRKRLALLTVLCYEGDESDSSHSHFAKLFTLLKKLCTSGTHPSSSGIKRPRILSAQSASSWEILTNQCSEKIFVEFPSLYNRKKVTIALLYLTLCDAASSFAKLGCSSSGVCVDFPCLMEFFALKVKDERGSNVDTIMGEYLSLLTTCCSERFRDCVTFDKYEPRQHGFDFAIQEQKDDGVETHKVSVKTYSDRESELLHGCEDKSRDSGGLDSAELMDLVSKLITASKKNTKWNAILLNCGGSTCEKNPAQFWNLDEAAPGSSCWCWEKKRKLLELTKKRTIHIEELIQGCFLFGHVYFDIRFALQSFQPSIIPRSFRIRQKLYNCMDSLRKDVKLVGNQALTFRPVTQHQTVGACANA